MLHHCQSSPIHQLARRPNHLIIEETQRYVVHLPLKNHKSRGVHQTGQQGEVERGKKDLKRGVKIRGGDRAAQGGDRAIQAGLSGEGEVGGAQPAVAEQQAQAKVARDEANPQEKPRERDGDKAEQEYLDGHLLGLQPPARLAGEPRPDRQHRPRPQNLQRAHHQAHACGEPSARAVLREVSE